MTALPPIPLNLSDATKHKFGRFVTPLYRREGEHTLASEGSGVLVRKQDAYWLFTAEHLFRETPEIFLCGKKGPISFPRSTFQGSRRLDLVFTRIRPDLVESIEAGGLTFFPGTLVEDCKKPPPPEECLFVGYPDRSIKIFHQALRIEAQTTSLRGYFLPSAEYQNFRLNKRFHIASRFLGFNEDPSGISLPNFDPHGLSGGAILHGRPPGLISLVGIATDFNAKNGVLSGSRFNELIPDLVRQGRNSRSAS